MPRDNKTPLIQKIAKQAYITFKGLKSSANGDNTLTADQQSELISLVTAVRAADLKIAPRKSKASSAAAGLQSPPVTYMHICETEVFSMGVFLLRTGASIPLHDHPNMNGMLKVLYGKVSVRCFDKLEDNLTVNAVPPHFDPPLTSLQTTSLWRSILRSVAEYSENSGPCLLTPLRDNLHQIDAVEGPAAFLDILAPPYNPDDGRDCHYYKVLQTVAERQTDGRSNEEQKEEEKEKEEETWLLEVPQPEDFWCGGEPYPGPAVSF
ncbi:2-aminoethanethiol dioxygenase [Seriola lalandi dorsalis]|uniref:2-aminoethanethiol (cysteamine) dioxygenase a n=1 Tax=Seriola lalandi dorsalis TaxID=1841481 RepID=A0A3B4XUT2_SERLL|nr:2-aminoethanethiol dioxygenase [Seriola lalandi dorsalis]XP_056222834.1 2-aminoethanethiol (cysteamine) dioxygenase a [Seriola aureovittata]